MKGLAGSSIRFASNHRTWDFILRTGKSTLIGNVLRPDPGIRCEFRNHQFNTKDPEIARMMVGNAFFHSHSGFILSPACLPDELIEVYRGLSVESKRKLLLGLIDGKTADEAFGLLSDDDIGAAASTLDDGPDVAAYQVKCPGSQCGRTFIGKNAASALRAHLAASTKCATTAN